MGERKRRTLQDRLLKEVDAAWSGCAAAESIFKQSLDAETDRMFLIGKAIAACNVALDRYDEAIKKLHAAFPDQIFPNGSHATPHLPSDSLTKKLRIEVETAAKEYQAAKIEYGVLMAKSAD